MSKRCSVSQAFLSARKATIALLILLFAVASLQAQSTNPIIQIERTHNSQQGFYVYVSVTIDNSLSQQAYGKFTLQISYDPAALSFFTATQGGLLDSCAWESFSYGASTYTDSIHTTPIGLIHLTGVADLDNGSAHPNSFLAGKSGTIAQLKFLVTNDMTYQCQSLPVRVAWLGCVNNTFFSPANDTLYMSQEVFDFPNSNPRIDFTYNITGTDCGLPLRLGGACAECDTASLPGVVQRPRSLIFWNGAVDVACADTVFQRGDLNLNGLPYEIADLVLYAYYFLDGLSVFPPSGVDRSVAASDVNADGRTLTFQDLTYLMRIITLDTLPVHKREVATVPSAYFLQDSTNHNVEVICSGQLAGASLTFLGNVVPSFVIPSGFGEDYRFDGNYTKVLILGDLAHRYGSGVWFTYQGEGTLQAVQTADWHDSAVRNQILHGQPNCGDHDASGAVDISDAVFILQFIFGGGIGPIDSHHGDVNCDNTCDISDVVYLIAYIFGGGPAPCNGC